MKRSRASRLIACLGDESAQVLPWMVLLVVLFLGVAGLCIDLGHAYIVQRELQASTDAAALAGGYALAIPSETTAEVTAAAKSFSSLTGDSNANSGLPGVTFSDSFKCLQTLVNENITCTGAPTGYNAYQVTQTSTISTFFIQALNVFRSRPMTSMTISTTATASMRGSTNQQYNVALLIDTTASMGDKDTDGNCNNTRINCALGGVQILLQSLTPCTSSNGSCVGFDNVSIFTFPAIEANTASKETSCPSKDPTVANYSTPSPGGTYTAPTGSATTYQVTGFMDNYSSTDSAGGALSTTSALSVAAGAASCQGLQTPGGKGTYYAGAIYAALSALNAEQAANPGSLNALIILSDGDADTSASDITASNGEKMTTNGTYPSAVDQCQQAITAAKSASATTTVYTIAYGALTTGSKSKNGGCATDTSGALAGLSPCTAMEDMATAPGDFYTDATTGETNACTSPGAPGMPIAEIFKAIAISGFTKSGLIPNNTT